MEASRIQHSQLTLMIVADDARQRLALSQVAQSLQLTVLDCIAAEELSVSHVAQAPSLWCIDVASDDDVLALIGEDAPMLMGFLPAPSMSTPGYALWKYTIEAKLCRVLKLDFSAQMPPQVASESNVARKALAQKPFATEAIAVNLPLVCVLGASAGGPDAVVQLLKQLPADLPLGMLLAQHHTVGMQPLLVDMIVNQTGWRARILTQEETYIESGCLYIVPADKQIHIDADGAICLDKDNWTGPYHPNISEVMQQMSAVYQTKMVGIILTGMMDDGSAAAQTVVDNGGLFWAQTAASSVAESQPNAARASGLVSFNGTPALLALELIVTLTHRASVSRK